MSYKVLHMVHSDQRRGAEVFAAQLANNLNRSQFESAMCVLHPTGGEGLPLDDIQVFAIDKKSRARGPFDQSKVFGIRKVLKSFQPDVLLAHGSSSLKYAALSRLFYRKSVNIYRNIGMASFWATSPMKVRMNRLMLDRFNLIVSLSEIVRNDFVNLYGVKDEKVALVPNGVDVSGFDVSNRDEIRNRYREALQIRQDDVVLINVGSLSPEKNQQELLTLMRDIVPDYPNVKLLLVGDGPQRRTLQDMAHRLGVEENVHFLGTRDDVPNLLFASDIFVLPSSTESMPGALIEAGIAGLSSVAYDVGAMADVLIHGETGLLAPQNEYITFKEAVVGLISNKHYRDSIGDSAQTRCLALFDIKKVAREYENIFLNLLDDKVLGTQNVSGIEEDRSSAVSRP